MDLNVLGPGPLETYLPYIPVRRENSLLPELRLYIQEDGQWVLGGEFLPLHGREGVGATG